MLGRAPVPALSRHPEPGVSHGELTGTSRARGAALSSSRAQPRQHRLLGARKGGGSTSRERQAGPKEENTWGAAKANRRDPQGCGGEENRDGCAQGWESRERVQANSWEWAPIPTPAHLRGDPGSPTELPTEHRTVKHTLEQAKIHQVPWEHGGEQLHIQPRCYWRGLQQAQYLRADTTVQKHHPDLRRTRGFAESGCAKGTRTDRRTSLGSLKNTAPGKTCLLGGSLSMHSQLRAMAGGTSWNTSPRDRHQPTKSSQGWPKDGRREKPSPGGTGGS